MKGNFVPGILAFVILISMIFTEVNAQVPQVPHLIDFARMKLKISEQARKDIQSDVDALYRSEKFFNIKLERIDLYFPIIERILREEGVPEDFKFLVIQESSLISDAVSTSNAVGFWQFKQDAGEEVGLQINAHVDERMNIVASTRGAATYLKKHNSYFDNWVYSLLAYYLGRGGASSVADKKLYGVNKMDIDKNTNWYILKFLAHKIAFEHAIGKNENPPLVLAEYTKGARKSLKEIGEETQVELEILEHYNKWLKKGKVPDDKDYTVILPLEPAQPKIQLASNEVEEKNTPRLLPGEKGNEDLVNIYPVIDLDLPAGGAERNNEPIFATINGRPGIIAREGDAVADLAALAGMKEDKFRKINDLKPAHKAKAGQYFYLKPKRNNAPVHYHTVQPGETLWEISQMYGIKQNNILKKNRMSNSGAIKTGMVLWMRYIRPANEEVAYRDTPAIGKNLSRNAGTAKAAGAERSREPANTSVSVNQESEDQKKQQKNQEKKEERSDAVDVGSEGKTSVIFTNEENNNDASKSGEKITDTIIEEPLTPQDEIIEKEAAFTTPELTRENEGKLTEGGLKIQDTKSGDETTEIGVFSVDDVKFVNTDAQTRNIEKQQTHVVQQGESLYGIARKYNIPLQELASWNQLKYNDPIKIGQVLLLNSPQKVTKEAPEDVRKPSENVQEKFVMHKVAAGETLYKIAREHNVTIKDVMEWNNKTDFNVAQGEVIKIKKLLGND